MTEKWPGNLQKARGGVQLKQLLPTYGGNASRMIMVYTGCSGCLH